MRTLFLSLGIIASWTVSAQVSVAFHCKDCGKDKVLLKTTLKDSLLEQQITKLAESELDKFRNNGFLNAKVASSNLKPDFRIIKIQRGPLFTWTKLNPGNLEQHVIQKLGYRSGIMKKRPLDVGRLNQLKSSIISYYEDHGHPFASMRFVDLKSVDDHTMEASIQVEKNLLVTIDSVHVKGNVKITDEFLMNYLNVKPSDLYNESVISNISTRIKELPFIKELKGPEVSFTKKGANLYLYLDKKGASKFTGIVGVLPDATGKVVITGDVKLNLKNLLGAGDELKLNWQRLQTSTQDLQVQANYPYLFRSPLGFNYELNLYRRDSSFINVKNELGTSLLLRGNNSLRAFYSVDLSNKLQAATLSSTEDVEFLSTRINAYGLAVQFRKLDYRLNPRKGLDLYLKGSVGTKKVVDSDSISAEINNQNGINNSIQLRFESNISGYVPFGKAFTVHINNQTGVVENETLFTNELFRIGGLKTVRGFDEQAIFASFYSIGTLELRYILEQNSYLYIFGQSGYYENKSFSLALVDHYQPSSFGAGISFETGAGIFSLNYALGNETGRFLVRSGKVHFGFVNFF